MTAYFLAEMFVRPQSNQISYTQFKQDVSQGKVAEITLKGRQVTGVLKPPKTKQAGNKKSEKAKANKRQAAAAPEKFQSYLPVISDPDLMPSSFPKRSATRCRSRI